MSKKGLDISTYQNGISMTAIQKAGYKFAILRAGFTGYGSGRTKCKDNCFEKFYKAAKAVDLPVGAYWFSCADSAAQGRAEAEYMYEHCLKGHKFEYPIYLDVEDSHWQSNNKKGVTDAIIAFCEYLEAKGYYCGIYASLFWFNQKIDTSRLKSYTKWVACWSSSAPSVSFSGFDMWQNSSSGSVSGMRVDTNVVYKDFPTIIKKAGKNGYKASSSGSSSSGSSSSSSGSPTTGKLAIDGIWGQATTKAVQKWLGLSETGIVKGQPRGEKEYIPCAKGGWSWVASYKGSDDTIRGLQTYLAKKSALSPGTIDGRIGRNTVKSLQTLLKAKGFYTGNIDSIAGTETCKAFQKWMNS